jgi:hypothetical protein
LLYQVAISKMSLLLLLGTSNLSFRINTKFQMDTCVQDGTEDFERSRGLGSTGAHLSGGSPRYENYEKDFQCPGRTIPH